MQTTDKFSVATPADWNPGDDVIVSPAGSCGTAEERMTSSGELKCEDWFFCTKKLDKDELLKGILKN
jgi:peroxiredoxin (alkyl hydroperoxide reductase subunit C)